MNNFLKTAVLAATMSAASLAYLPAAYAINTVYYPPETLYTLPNGSQAVIPADIGGAASHGIMPPNILGGFFGMTNYSSQSYISPGPAYTRSYGVAARLQPRSPQWYSYCQSRYRTFDPASGTFIGYDGLQHFCR